MSQLVLRKGHGVIVLGRLILRKLDVSGGLGRIAPRGTIEPIPLDRQGIRHVFIVAEVAVAQQIVIDAKGEAALLVVGIYRNGALGAVELVVARRTHIAREQVARKQALRGARCGDGL